MENKDLDFMINKRLADLMVMGIDVTSNTCSKDAKTGKLKVNSKFSTAINQKVTAIIGMAKVLNLRGETVRVNLINQHPYIREKLKNSIEKSGLLEAPKIKGRVTRKKRVLPKSRRRL